MTNKDRLKEDISIRKCDDHYEIVQHREFDFSDKGFFTTDDKVQKIFTLAKVEEQINSTQAEIDSRQPAIDANDKFLEKVESENKKHWDSKEFNSFMNNYEKKYKKLLNWKAKYDEYCKKKAENEYFKTDLENSLKFNKIFRELKEKWENDSN